MSAAARRTRKKTTVSSCSYVVAIPTYNRAEIIAQKTLAALADGHVPASRVYLFVANATQAAEYREHVPHELYHEIVVGKPGITPQRNFIRRYFPINKYIVSMDDDINSLQKLRGENALSKIHNLDAFFCQAYQKLRQEKLFIWGIYPTDNPFFMQPKITTGLKFLVGQTYGFINRPQLRALRLTVDIKEDVQQSILYFKQDGGVVRYNNVTAKTTNFGQGGIGKDRRTAYAAAARQLHAQFPELVTVFHRSNGLAEVKLANMPRQAAGG